jgi:farnesyl diphosphate synthase
MRRGKPTCHVEYDEATALLVGDALQTLAFQKLAARTSGRLGGAPTGNAGAAGHGIRLARHGRRPGHRSGLGRAAARPGALEFMHIHKTGALIRAASCSARIAARRRPMALERLGHYAKSHRPAVPGGRRHPRRRSQQ